MYRRMYTYMPSRLFFQLYQQISMATLRGRWKVKTYYQRCGGCLCTDTMIVWQTVEHILGNLYCQVLRDWRRPYIGMREILCDTKRLWGWRCGLTHLQVPVRLFMEALLGFGNRLRACFAIIYHLNDTVIGIQRRQAAWCQSLWQQFLRHPGQFSLVGMLSYRDRHSRLFCRRCQCLCILLSGNFWEMEREGHISCFRVDA